MAAKVKTILVTHAQPADENSPYHQLATAFNVKVDFADFITVEGIPTPEFRKQNINPLDYTGIIFTSKVSVDHFFRICKDLRIEMPAEAKYFCMSDATAKYLQKYITIRKRKLFVGERTTADLLAIIKKHGSEKFLFPAGDNAGKDLIDQMTKLGYQVKEARVYQTEFLDIKDIPLAQYDMLCFFSPLSISALQHHFPKFKQDKKLVAVFGKATAKAAEEAGLRIDIEAPKPDVPSMTMAIEHFLRG